MKFYPTLHETLENRFTDPDEIRDISQYGIDGGFSGFIYSSELYEFFEQFESDIEDVLDDLGFTLNDIVQDKDSWTFQEVRERAVWIVVESWCHAMADECVAA